MSPEETVTELFNRFASRSVPPETLAELFAEDVDFYVAGDTETVPWIGRKSGRTGVADFWGQIQERLQSEVFTISNVISDGDKVLVVGYLESRLRETGRLISTEFVFDFDVTEGQVTRFRMLEDSFAISQAFTPSSS